jgi:hypothetical protein
MGVHWGDNQCRSNLIMYRQQALAEEQQNAAKAAALADGLAAAGRAMQAINRPQDVNVNWVLIEG